MRYAKSSEQERKQLVAWIRANEFPLGDANDLAPLLEAIGDRRIVLLGEASHGTSEYYVWRHLISAHLIREMGFSFIGVEGDWPDCYRLNRYVRDLPDSGASARNVLHAFNRWPTWMWANREIVRLAEWMRDFNQSARRQAGFYGLDVYSLWDSMAEVIQYLERVDPQAAKFARSAYSCFDPYSEDAQEYAQATALVPTTCEGEVVSMLTHLRREGVRYREDSREDYFNAEQNALVARNAENYYRAMVRWGPESWNVRDFHMVDTLERLLDFHGPHSKAIVWEHNTHIGDARATDMALADMVNVGQLVRERFGEDNVFALGFGSYRGSVIAGQEWGAKMERMHVPPAIPGSWEEILHHVGSYDRLLLFDAPGAKQVELLHQPLSHRAIGVVYDPHLEMRGNYVPSVMARRYDGFLHVDESRALHPLHLETVEEHEFPETYPSGQ
jgi:erythromycin esterase-like protein